MIICQIKDLDAGELMPTPREMWVVLQKMYMENEKLKKKVKKLELVVNKDVRKLDMLDWLNQNDKGVDINIWLKTKTIF